MVARIGYGKSLRHIVYYNETKVGKGVAECIAAGNYPLNLDRMSLSVKIGCMQQQIDLNHRAELTTMHISLNFAPEESSLGSDKLAEIAEAYMQGIGFGEQPFLVYRHHDAGHPHIHIVTTTVREDGTNIDTFMIGKIKSEPVRRSIEAKYSLVRAEDHKKKHSYRPEPVTVAKVNYGRTETKKAIGDVLGKVVSDYKFSSLSELNAVLSLYNVNATRGEEGSRTFRHGGLLYRAIDQNGNAIGVPIKASRFRSTPTLQKLEGYFHKNQEKPSTAKSRVRNAIDLIFRKQGQSFETFRAKLRESGIDLVVRSNEHGFIYGLTYVDHNSRTVFNGSDLGKQYSAKAVQERCLVSQLESKLLLSQDNYQKHPKIIKPESSEQDFSPNEHGSSPPALSIFSDLLDCLLQVEQTADYVPYELRQRKKKRRKKRRNINR